MERNRKMLQSSSNPAVWLIKCLLAVWLFTGGALLLLALLLYRLGLSENVISVAILAVYVIACLLAGILMGKCTQTRRFLWGLLIGTLYFVILAALTASINHGFKDFGTHFFTTWMICAGSGMLGGMLS